MSDISESAKRIPPFIEKLYTILEVLFGSIQNDLYRDCIGWLDNGKMFKIRSEALFVERVLPKFFKHSKIESFIRQVRFRLSA